MQLTITPGAPVSSEEDAATPDLLMSDLLQEILERYNDIEFLHSYLRNEPLGNEFELEEEKTFTGLEQLRDMSRSNYARLVVSATTDRLGVLGFRTSVAADEFGDEVVRKAFDRDDMGVKAQEAMDLACGYRTCYLYVDPLTKRQRVVPPTNGAIITDAGGEVAAGLILFRDRFNQRDVAHLYIRMIHEETGEVVGSPRLFIATRDIENPTKYHSEDIRVTAYDSEVPLNYRIGHGWVWWRQKSVETERIPVTLLKNKNGLSEFEEHTPIIDRINHMIFQRLVIVTMQAFRQRAVKGNFDDIEDDMGGQVDFNEFFSPGPNQLWLLPPDAEMWESSTTEIQGILEATRSDVKDLASHTYTPISYLSDAVNMSAEAAGTQKENYVSKVTDRQRRFGARICRHISILLEVLGEKERSEISDLEVIWQPVSIASLTERSASAQSMKSAGFALSTIMRMAHGMTPQEISRAQSEIVDEQLTQTLAQSLNQQTPLQKSAAQQSAVGFENAKKGKAKDE